MRILFFFPFSFCFVLNCCCINNVLWNTKVLLVFWRKRSLAISHYVRSLFYYKSFILHQYNSLLLLIQISPIKGYYYVIWIISYPHYIIDLTFISLGISKSYTCFIPTITNLIIKLLSSVSNSDLGKKIKTPL